MMGLICTGKVMDADGSEHEYVYLSLGTEKADIPMIENDFRPGSKVKTIWPVWPDEDEYQSLYERLT